MPYSGAGPEGRSVMEMFHESNTWPENAHDYVQWLFSLNHGRFSG